VEESKGGEVALQETEAPPKAPPMTPLEKLRLLEKKALDKGISKKLFEDIRSPGDCPNQVQTRIGQLDDWLLAH